jgi:hypothetical protein
VLLLREESTEKTGWVWIVSRKKKMILRVVLHGDQENVHSGNQPWMGIFACEEVTT